MNYFCKKSNLMRVKNKYSFKNQRRISCIFVSRDMIAFNFLINNLMNILTGSQKKGKLNRTFYGEKDISTK